MRNRRLKKASDIALEIKIQQLEYHYPGESWKDKRPPEIHHTWIEMMRRKQKYNQN